MLYEHHLNLVTLKDASTWATKYINRKVTVSNISYLIQYGKIRKHKIGNQIFVSIDELKSYYDTIFKNKNSGSQFREDINWSLSFDQYTETERTKHVHGIHPYKGKFIPQLVEYFLDLHTDTSKGEVYFYKGDIVLDPFCGSGTTLVQANELGIHAIGIDVSPFNTLLSNVKVRKYNLDMIKTSIHRLNLKLKEFQKTKNNTVFDEVLKLELTKFNARHFPSPEYKRKVTKAIINEYEYSKAKEEEFLNIYNGLVQKYKIKVKQDKDETFLDKWFLDPVRMEIELLANEIKNIDNIEVREVLMVILSRTARSCRATTHEDLATLKDPVITPYYCKKHKKICKPVFTITKWWEFYAKDTIKRLSEFDKLRTDTFQICLTGDARKIDIYVELARINPEFANLMKKQKIKGIFTSPPYVGLIDYHDQHAYAYELFGLRRNDDLEIGSLSKGQSKEQLDAYVRDIAEALLNCKKYLQEDYNVFLVANDKFNLYPKIAELSGMKIVNQFKRPVLNRVEKNRNTLYVETIFHLKEK